MAWRGPITKPVVNKPSDPIKFGPEMSQGKKPIAESVAGPEHTPNRAYNMRRDTDKVKNLSISLVDIDWAIMSYLDNVISPTILDVGRQVKVPINYASPERWKAIRKDGVIRDKNGKIQTPAIAFRRSSMQRNDGLITFNRYLQYPAVKHFSEKNKYDKFSIMNGFSPVKEVYSVAMPDHVIINYEFIVWTELIEQGNEIIEAINFATEDYWGDKTKFKFRTTISDYNFETATEAGNDRMVKSTFSLMCYAYLLPDKFENYKSVVQKAFTPRKVVFGVQELIKNSMTEVASTKPISVSIAGGIASSNTNNVIAASSQFLNYANSAGFATNALYSSTASYIDFSEMVGDFNGVNITSQAGVTGSINTQIAINVTSESGSVSIDTIPISFGNAAKWLISINDGVNNFKASEMVANWNNSVVKYYNTEVSEIGSVPVALSVNNSSGNINLIATPFSGTWTIKMLRMVV